MSCRAVKVKLMIVTFRIPWTMFMGDDSESGLYSPGDEGPTGWEKSRRFLEGSYQIGVPLWRAANAVA